MNNQFKDFTCVLQDAYGNQVLALVRYNVDYPRDFRVLSASVVDNGKEIVIANTTNVEAQYFDMIFKMIIIDKEDYTVVNSNISTKI